MLSQRAVVIEVRHFLLSNESHYTQRLVSTPRNKMAACGVGVSPFPFPFLAASAVKFSYFGESEHFKG